MLDQINEVDYDWPQSLISALETCSDLEKDNLYACYRSEVQLAFYDAVTLYILNTDEIEWDDDDRILAFTSGERVAKHKQFDGVNREIARRIDRVLIERAEKNL